jgi:tetratricopeptide (TPR) repeat protein
LFFVWVRLYERFGGRLEAMIYRAAAQSWGPMIGVSLGRRGKARGFGRVWTTDAKWQETASTLLDHADLVLMMFSDTTGTSWELEQLAARGRLAHTVFVIPPAYALRENDDMGRYHLERDYRVFAERLAALGYTAPAYRHAMAFRVDPDPARAAWVEFAEDFDKGRSTHLRDWLRTQRAEAGRAGESKGNSAKWRGYTVGAVRIAAAAALGFLFASDQDRKVSELARQEDLLRSQCALESTVDDATTVAACSALIQRDGGMARADLETINLRGLAHLRRSETAQAIADFTGIIAREPGNAVAFYNRAIAREQGGDVDGAFSDLGQVTALEADSTVVADAHLKRGMILNDRDDAAGALVEFDAALDLQARLRMLLEPEWGATAYVLRAYTQMSLQNYPAAIADGTLALELQPQDARAFMVRGLAYEAGGPNAAAQAAADFDSVLALEPGNAGALRGRGLARIRLGQDEAGLADLDAADAVEAAAGGEGGAR